MPGRRHQRIRLRDEAGPSQTSTFRREEDDPDEDGGTSTVENSGYLSIPASPSTLRRPRFDMSRHASFLDAPDERSPLLIRSRIRISSTHGSPRGPHLSRNQSYTGMSSGTTLHLVALCPVLTTHPTCR